MCKFNNKTEYAIAIVPFGGFVKMAGETLEDKEEGCLEGTDFLSQNIFKRFMIIFSGPLMNYALAIFLLFLVFCAGKPTLAPIIGGLVEEYPAVEAGVTAGDVIVSVDGVSVNTWDELRDFIAASKNEFIELNIEREGTLTDIQVLPIIVTEKDLFGDEQTLRKIGIYPSEETVIIEYSFPEAVAESFKTTFAITGLTFKSIARLVTGRLHPKALSGPLGIMVITSKAAKRGLIYLTQLTALLSVSLAIFNILPIPALDGGHLFFILCEAIVRRPIPFKLQERFAQVGFVLLMVLMVFVVWNDAINFALIDKLTKYIPFVK